MLIGQYTVKITNKQRLAVPSRYRQELGEEVIVAKWYEKCLVVVSKKSWSALLLKLTGKVNMITQPVRDTDRFILGSAFEVNLDSQGRFVLPKVLKEYANLRGEVIFVGLGDRVEIWDRELWEKRETYVQRHASEMIEELSSKGGES